MWLVFFAFFASSSAFPFGSSWGRNDLENYNVQLVDYKGLPHQRQSLCLPSPLLHRICLPSAFQFFLPLRTHEAEQERCLLIPIMRTYVVKVCPRNESEENLKSLKEIIKEAKTETEKERLLRDNANIEVNGGEVEPEFFVKKERSDDTKESEVKGVNSETENKISKILEEAEVSTENESPEKPPTDKNFDDENVTLHYENR